MAVKSEEQQAVLSMHRMRELLEKQRKQLANQLRGLLGEFGIAIPLGIVALRNALPQAVKAVPGLLQPTLEQAAERWRELQQQCAEYTRQIEQQAAASPLCQRLMREAGIGPISASADPAHYRNGRQLSASLGIVPRQHSTGGKPLLLGISKRGDSYLRRLLIHGARGAALRTREERPAELVVAATGRAPWSE